MQYIDIAVYSIFALSTMLGIIYDLLYKRKTEPEKTKEEVFISFLMDLLMHLVMLGALISVAHLIEIYAHWVNGGDLKFFPAQPGSGVSLDQFLKLFDLSCILVTLHFLIRGLIDVFRGI